MAHDSSSKSKSAAAISVLRLSDNVSALSQKGPREPLNLAGAFNISTGMPTAGESNACGASGGRLVWTAIESLDASMWRLDLRSGRVDMTPDALKSFERVFNLDPQCLEEGRFGFALHAHPDDRDRLLAMLASGLEKSFRTHFRVVDREGRHRWINLKCSHVVKGGPPPMSDSIWFFAENDSIERGEQERQKRLLADRILSNLFGSNLSTLPPEEFSSISLMTKIAEKWKPLVQAKDIRWTGPDLAPLGAASILEGSELLLMLMMDSLFENALEALAPPAISSGSAPLVPWIRFEFFEDTDSVYLAISDSGDGVPLVHRGQIFEPFFSTRSESSSGLGLTLARSAAEWHGGQLRLDHFSKNTRLVGQIPKRFRRPVAG